MKLKFLFLSLIMVFSGVARAQMPTNFNYRMDLDVDLTHAVPMGAADCINSAKLLIPNEVLRTKFSQDLSCSILPQINKDGKSRSEMCVTTTDPSHGGQFVMSGLFYPESNSFWMWDRTGLKLTDDPRGHVWLRIAVGKKGEPAGTFEIRGISKSEWELSQVAGLSNLDATVDCKLTLPTLNHFGRVPEVMEI